MAWYAVPVCHTGMLYVCVGAVGPPHGLLPRASSGARLSWELLSAALPAVMDGFSTHGGFSWCGLRTCGQLEKSIASVVSNSNGQNVYIRNALGKSQNRRRRLHILRIKKNRIVQHTNAQCGCVFDRFRHARLEHAASLFDSSHLRFARLTSCMCNLPVRRVSIWYLPRRMYSFSCWSGFGETGQTSTTTE